MKSGRFDIVRKENERRLWLEAAEDLASAKSRIRELTSLWPGEFEVMDQDSHQLIAATDVPEHSTGNSAEQSPATH